ncbi:MAG: prepilin-type N-terminal cleavage/methylation domain-containing protein [Acidobacteriota bacterium]
MIKKARASLRKRHDEQGFSLVEMLVVMAMMGLLMAGLTVVFSRSSFLARAQTEQANMQQSLRVSQHEMARFLRMAGAGGLPITWTQTVPTDFKADALPVDYETMGSFPTNGFAVAVANNTATGTTIPASISDGLTPHWVIPGSDILTVRGVFTTPVFYLSGQFTQQTEVLPWVDSSDDTIGGADAEVSIPNRVSGSFSQPVEELIEVLEEKKDNGVPVALLVRDLTNPNAYFVVQWDANRSPADLTTARCGNTTTPSSWTTTSADPRESVECLTINVKLDADGDESYGAQFANLAMGTNLQSNAGSIDVSVPNAANRLTLSVPKQVGSIGILEEFRFYVRAEWEIPGDKTSRLTPVLSRAEYIPGTEVLIERVDIVQNMLDLQIAIGIETNSAIGAAGFASIDDVGSADDEVLFNHPDDLLDGAIQLAAFSPQTWFNPGLEFHYLRLTTVSQAARPTTDNWVPRIGPIEDIDRTASFEVDGVTYNYNNDRLYQRGYLQTVVEMRNLK